MGKKKGGGGGGGRRGRGSDSHRMGGGVGKKHASKKMFVVNHDTALEMWRAKSVGPFERGDKTLVVGDGDLSFSLALTTALGGKGLTATTYDTTRGVLSKYPHADNIISTLGSKGVRVFNGVDALTLHVDPRLTTLKTDVDARIPQELYDGYTAKLKREQKRLEREKRLKEKQQRFGKNYRPRQNEEEDEEEDILDPATYSRLHSLYDKIVFNFPHLGGVDVDKNKLLLAQFFLSSLCLVRRGRANGSDDQTDGNDDDDDNRTETECGMIMVGLRDTPFYRGWEIEKVANDVGLRLVRKEPFRASQYVGYAPQRTDPAVRDSPDVNSAFMYIFRPAEVVRGSGGASGGRVSDRKKMKRQRKAKPTQSTEALTSQLEGKTVLSRKEKRLLKKLHAKNG
eukprot:TRINITY_DN2256_c0_g1_i3.p1 TRINITY_DN2256_c0_g1~~TRINITY_DN2256_c0_g1_i3.p1  ORF type:complete len:397 (+),score=92.73 TRINITY_DN2256_c0_g1_i3:283-1473(+)